MISTYTGRCLSVCLSRFIITFSVSSERPFIVFFFWGGGEGVTTKCVSRFAGQTKNRLFISGIFGHLFISAFSLSIKEVYFLQNVNNCGFCSNRILHYFPLFVRSCVTGVTSHISHIYKGINAMLIIRGPIKPYIF